MAGKCRNIVSGIENMYKHVIFERKNTQFFNIFKYSIALYPTFWPSELVAQTSIQFKS